MQYSNPFLGGRCDGSFLSIEHFSSCLGLILCVVFVVLTSDYRFLSTTFSLRTFLKFMFSVMQISSSIFLQFALKSV